MGLAAAATERGVALALAMVVAAVAVVTAVQRREKNDSILITTTLTKMKRVVAAKVWAKSCVHFSNALNVSPCHFSSPTNSVRRILIHSLFPTPTLFLGAKGDSDDRKQNQMNKVISGPIVIPLRVSGE